jgi:hypothetical protein
VGIGCTFLPPIPTGDGCSAPTYVFCTITLFEAVPNTWSGSDEGLREEEPCLNRNRSPSKH